MLWNFFLKLYIVLLIPLSRQSPIASIENKAYGQRLKWNALVVVDTQGYEETPGFNVSLDAGFGTKERKLKIFTRDIKTLEKSSKKDRFKSTLFNKTLLVESFLLEPAFECDRWDPKTRTCWLKRNIGDTVTFYLSAGFQSHNTKPGIVWKRKLAQKGSRVMKEFVINPNKSSGNLMIGKQGYILRVSPITDLDVDDNIFCACIIQRHGHTIPPNAEVNFKIQILPEELGFVYLGETLDLAIQSYVSLPLESMRYHWYAENQGDYETLSSNMRVSTSGETLRISELRQEQEGLITCSIYTNKNIHATKRRFLIKGLEKNKDVLATFYRNSNTYQEEKFKKKREINEAVIDGDIYTIIRYNEFNTYNIIPKNKSVFEDDKVHETISYCSRSIQCAKHAICVRNRLENVGFCRCQTGFYGPGIFCREFMQ